MILNYYGVETDPRDLNNWLKERFLDRNRNGVWDPDEPSYGYDKDGGVNWQAVAEYSGGEVSYLGRAGRDDLALNRNLCGGQPVILDVTGHYVVTTGHIRVDQTDTWSINDPGFDRTNLLDYGNDYAGMRRYGPRQADNSSFVLRAHSPVELFVTDPEGRSLGYDPETGAVVHDIPGGEYYQEGPILGVPETKVIEILSPIDGGYLVKVVGTDAGDYTLDYQSYIKSGSLEDLQVVTAQISPGEIHEYSFSYTSVPHRVLLPVVMRNR